MEYVKKSILGYRPISSDAQLNIDTQVVLPLWVYRKLQADINQLQTAKSVATRKAEEAAMSSKKKIAVLKEQLDDSEAAMKLLLAHDKLHQETICRLTDERNKAIAASENNKALNVQLLRIQRERFNAARGITPKRQHDGYLVLRSEQGRDKHIIHHNYQKWKKQNPYTSRDFEETEIINVVVWRTIIQSPHDASIPYDAVCDEILGDLRLKVLPDMGCACWQDSDRNGEYTEAIGAAGEPTCCAYRWSLIANGLSGLWEIILYTSMPLKIPKSRFPS